MCIVNKFKEILIQRDYTFTLPAKEQGHTLCQDYQEFLYTVSNGTINRGNDGWKFWGTDAICQLNDARNKFGIESLPEILLPEYHYVFADFKDGERFLSFRKFHQDLRLLLYI